MADTPIARNIAARWNDARRSERSAEQAPIVVIKGGAGSDLPAKRPRGEAHHTVSIHHLPVPVLQLDAMGLRALFAGLKARGDAEHLLSKGLWQGGIAQAGLFIADANEMAVSLLQASSSDDLVGPASYLFAASPETIKRLMRAWFDGTKLFSEPMKMRSFKGAVLDVKLSVTFPSAESLDTLLVVLEDITGRRQPHEHEVDPLHTARLSMLGRLATSIAHEVNQPLAAIVTDCETTMRHLSRDEPNLAKLGELAARMAASAHRASEIVKRVRGMASGQTNTRMPLDLNDIVKDALSFVGHETDMHAIRLSVACGPGLPAFLGDRIQMQQVVVNLLVNAIEAVVSSGRRPRRIEIATSEADGRVQFSIRDSGDGISAADLGRIFDCFYTTKQDGVGVGLSICQSIVLNHGGDISAANAGDGGALFRVSLPAG
ncbi:sensor histidine kinase [Rhizobium sp. YAF28]|uniref:sensor histidine kinase n=1 Tax=Rhizobium sp. YAF28 TaxID=3233081 RepID=UPI003F9D18AE